MRATSSFTLILVMTTCLFFSCKGKEKPFDDAAAIRLLKELHGRYAEAILGGDFDKVASFYAENASLLPPSGYGYIGRDGIIRYFQKMTEKGPKLVSMDLDSWGPFLLGNERLMCEWTPSLYWIKDRDSVRIEQRNQCRTWTKSEATGWQIVWEFSSPYQ